MTEFSSNLTQFTSEFAQMNRLNRLYVVKILSIILTVAASGGTIGAIWSVIAGASFMIAAGWAVAGTIFFISYLLARFGSDPERANAVICIQVR